MATYLIGDIQGCLEPLEHLLETIRFDPSEDRLWSCGDVVNRGGQSLEVLRLLHGCASCVSVTLGNHDFALLAADARYPKGGCKNREFEAIFQAPDREVLIQWLSHQPLAAWSKRFGLLRFHAGVLPAWDRRTTLALASEVSTVLNSHRRDQLLRKIYGKGPKHWDPHLQGWKRLRLITNVLTRLRFCDAGGRVNFKLTGPPGSQKKPLKPWFKHRNRATRDVRVAFGHWAALGLRIRKRFIALDSGCVWGGELSAFRLEDERLFQVPGKRS